LDGVPKSTIAFAEAADMTVEKYAQAKWTLYSGKFNPLWKADYVSKFGGTFGELVTRSEEDHEVSHVEPLKGESKKTASGIHLGFTRQLEDVNSRACFQRLRRTASCPHSPLFTVTKIPRIPRSPFANCSLTKTGKARPGRCLLESVLQTMLGEKCSLSGRHFNFLDTIH
jgi:hypothetical protein